MSSSFRMMVPKSVVAGAALLLLATLAGCGSDVEVSSAQSLVATTAPSVSGSVKSPQSSGETALPVTAADMAGTWLGIRVAGENVPPKHARLSPITFTKSGTYSWTNQCNGNSGSYTVKQNTFTQTRVGASTSVSCRGPEHDNLLGQAVRVELNRGDLVFLGADGAEVAAYRRE